MMETTGPVDRTTVHTESDDAVVTISGLKKHFKQSANLIERVLDDADVVRAVDGVNLTIEEGETLAVVGESGCGKSTLAKTLLRLHEPTDGSIRYRGTELTDLSESEIRTYRQEMQMIFQDPLGSLNPSHTIGEIITAPMEVHSIGKDDEDRRQRANELLEQVGLGSAYFHRSPRQLSGGQQQRVGIARALTVDPGFLVADEPTSALDVSVQAKVLNLLDELTDKHDMAMLFIAHDLSTVRHIADRVAVMYLGKIVECAPVETLFDSPSHPYTKALLSAVPRIDPENRPERIHLDGVVPSPMDPPSGCRFHTRCPELIPPDGWNGTQEMFRRVFRFRTRVLSGSINVSAIKRRAGDESNTEIITEMILDEVFPGDPRSLPPEASDVVTSAAFSLAEEKPQRAKDLLQETFQTPCERDSPERRIIADGQAVSCHRVE